LATLERTIGFLFILSCLWLFGRGLFKPLEQPGLTTWTQSTPLNAYLPASLLAILLAIIVAVIYLAYHFKRRCDHAEAALEQLNVALECSNQLLDRLTNTDLVTETLNRYGLEKILVADSNRALRSGIPLIALVIEVEDLKQIDEKLGHSARDPVLKEVAERIKQCTRSFDRVARVTDDRFCVLLHEARPEDAVLVAKRMTESIVHEPIATEDSRFNLTISIGLSVLPQGITTVHGILELTKASLEKYKGLQKNKAPT
jgi:diguanylate cyclase (GGDEF)-like protein